MTRNKVRKIINGTIDLIGKIALVTCAILLAPIWIPMLVHSFICEDIRCFKIWLNPDGCYPNYEKEFAKGSYTYRFFDWLFSEEKTVTKS